MCADVTLMEVNDIMIFGTLEFHRNIVALSLAHLFAPSSPKPTCGCAQARTGMVRKST